MRTELQLADFDDFDEMALVKKQAEEHHDLFEYHIRRDGKAWDSTLRAWSVPVRETEAAK